MPQLEAVFITVDPDRDTPEIMKNYLKGMCYESLRYMATIINTKTAQ